MKTLAVLASVVALAASATFVRVNQVGYLASAAKVASIISTDSSLNGKECTLVSKAGKTVLTARLSDTGVQWNSNFPKTYQCDFSSFNTPGEYTLSVPSADNAKSPVFALRSTSRELFTSMAQNSVFYFQASRDGASQVVSWRKPSHMNDRAATVYKTPSFDQDNNMKGDPAKVSGLGKVNVEGGWFDAGDYLKFVETTSYVVDLMFFSLRQYPNTPHYSALLSEANFGIDWLFKMFDYKNKVLYYQVGVGDATSATGDHSMWRLPEVDDSLSDADNKYLKNRPVFRAAANNSKISPNLAGRLAAAFALCFQVSRNAQCLLAARAAMDLANTSPGSTLMSTAPFDYYSESEWKSDMALGAIEMYNAYMISGDSTAAQTFLGKATSYLGSMTTEPLNLYDVSSLATYEIARAAKTSDQSTYSKATAALKKGLDSASKSATSDPFGLWTGYSSSGDIVPETIGWAVTARLYQELTGSSAYASFSSKLVDWVLGANGWGSSFIIGGTFDGTGTSPKCPQHQIDNLLDKRFLGGVVDGPNKGSMDSDFFEEARACPASGAKPFVKFNRGITYWDDVKSWASNEPAIDYTAVSVVLFSQCTN
eukprot:m51a1_g12375 putative glycoside hydrolase family protein (597) ;mRNA; r:608863-610845